MAKINNPVTKKIVRDELRSTETRFEKKLEEKADVLREEMKKLHNQVMEKLDSIVGMFKKFDEEHTILTYRVSEHSDKLENHEERIGKLEKIPQT